MKISQLTYYSFVTTAAAAAMLAGCGGSQPPIGAPGTLPQSRAITTQGTPYARSVPLLYVTNSSSYNDVKVYHANGKDPSPIEVISDDLESPVGDCLDGDGTLYVVNEPAGPGWVTEFPAGKTKPSKIIQKGINTPSFCAIDSDGNIWVTNIGGQNVTEYKKGSTKPHAVITDGIFYPDGIADQSGNIYVANRFTEGSYGHGPGNVVVYASGSKSPSRTITDGVVSPVGITVDATGFLARGQDAGANLAYRCADLDPFISEAELRTQAADSFAGDLRVRAERHACAIWKVDPMPAAFNDPVRSKVPILMLEGSDDPVTPPKYAVRHGDAS